MNRRVSKKKIIFFQETLLEWYRDNGRDFPWRKKNISIYQRIISEVLLQRTKAETIKTYFPLFISKYPSWKSISLSPLNEIEEFIKPIGLYRTRSTSLKKLADEMVKRNGRFPRSRDEIESIPGIGQYIANAILLFVHNEPQPLLDVNMARLLERFFGERKLADIRYDPYLQQLSQQIIEHEKSWELNWGILDYASLICLKKKPFCSFCILRKKCLLNSINSTK